MEQRRLELTLTRLQNALEEKVHEINLLKSSILERQNKLKMFQDVQEIKIEFFQRMKQFADLSIEAELLQISIEERKNSLRNVLQVIQNTNECIEHNSKLLAKCRMEKNTVFLFSRITEEGKFQLEELQHIQDGEEEGEEEDAIVQLFDGRLFEKH